MPVFVSLYPPLNSYIKNVLLESLSLLNENKLQKFELRLHKDEEILEKFFININYEQLKNKNSDELVSGFRSCIHSLETRCKSVKKVSHDCRFKILLHTKSYDFSNESKTHDFLWVRDDASSQGVDKGEVIPIAMKSNSSLIQFYVEKFNKE